MTLFQTEEALHSLRLSNDNIIVSWTFLNTTNISIVSREVKHDVYGKQQKWNFCRPSPAICTVESKYLYLLWIVRDTFLFLCDLFKDYKKTKENQR